MDADHDPKASMEGISDSEGEHTERRHRRDFVGTEMEKAKKVSRRNQKKRHRPGLIHVEEVEDNPSNSSMETATSPPASKKKAGPIGVKGATRSFNVVLDNDMTPEEAISAVLDESNDLPTTAKTIAKYLWEPKTHIFYRCLETFSRQQMVAWLKETIEIEKGDGMATMTGSRRKSPGGVFFTLVSRDADDEQKIKTVGIPRIKEKDEKRGVRHRQGTVQGQKPKYTALEDITTNNEEEEEEGAESSGLAAVLSPLDPSRAKRNPFAATAASEPSSSKPIGSIFGNSDEDLGEAVTM